MPNLLPLLAVGAVIGSVCGIAGYLVQTARNEAAEATPPALADAGYFAASPSGFDMKDPGAHVPAALTAPPRETPRSMPTFQPVPGMSPLPAKVPAAPAPAKPARSSAGTVASPTTIVQKDGRFVALLSSPASFLTQKTFLGSASRLRVFLGDAARSRRYVEHPIVAGVLASPALVKLLAKPAVVRAFVTSPAMQDPAAVQALASSPLAKAVLNSPGVVENVRTDPQFMKRIVDEPQTADWLARHPSAGMVFAQMGQ